MTKLGMACLILAAPLMIIIGWLFLNQAYPSFNEAYFIKYSQHYYRVYQDSGPWACLKAVYLFRGVKPLFQPVMALPFLILFQGNVLLALKGISLFLSMVLMTVLYLFSREFLSKIDSVVATFVMFSLPWVIGQIVFFKSEVIQLVAYSLFAYFIYRSDLFRHSTHTFWAGLAFVISCLLNPVLGAINLGIPLSIVIYASRRKGTVSRNDLLFSLLLPCLFICLFFLLKQDIDFESDRSYFLYAFASSMILGGIVYWKTCRSTGRSSRNFFAFTFTIWGGIIFWFFPFIDRIYTYVQIGRNYGSFTSNFSIISFYRNLYDQFGGYLLGVLVLFVLVPVFKSFKVALRLWEFRVLALVAIIISALAYFFQDERFYLFSIGLVYFVLLMNYLREDTRHRTKKIAVIVILSFGQYLFTFQHLFGKGSRWPLKIFSTTTFLSRPHLEQDPALDFYKFLKKAHSLHVGVSKGVLGYLNLQLAKEELRGIHTYTLDVIRNESGDSPFFESPYYFGLYFRDNLPLALSYLRLKYTHILLGPINMRPFHKTFGPIAEHVLGCSSASNSKECDLSLVKVLNYKTTPEQTLTFHLYKFDGSSPLFEDLPFFDIPM